MCLIRKNEIFILNFLLVWYSLLKKANFFVIFAWLLPGPKLWYLGRPLKIQIFVHF